MTHRQHLLVVLYAGNYQEAWQRITSGQAGTWYPHQFMVKSFSELRPEYDVTVLTCKSETAYEATLPDGSRVVALGLSQPEQQTAQLLAKIAEQRPTHLLIRAPLRAVFKWATQQPQVRTIAVLAQSYMNQGWRDRLRHWRIARRLNRPPIEWVFNHNVNSSGTLQTIGVQPEKIIPWDWPQFWPDHPAKDAPPAPTTEQPWTAFYVGSLLPAKGVGDCIRAIAHLQQRGVNVQLKIAGKGQLAHFQALAAQLQVEDSVEFVGLIANTEVVPRMQAADLVLLPSRHAYPEGLPFTLNEALFSRTPIVASDHPTFRGILVDRHSAMVFPSGNGEAIAAAIETLCQNPALYAQLSHNAEQTWQNLQVPVLWPELIERWLRDQPSDRQWLHDHALSSGRYDQRLNANTP